MTPELLTAILNFATRFGFAAAEEILKAHNATIDDAIAALGRAKEKSLESYIADDLKSRNTPAP